jgi:hypothetical protein
MHRQRRQHWGSTEPPDPPIPLDFNVGRGPEVVEAVNGMLSEVGMAALANYLTARHLGTALLDVDAPKVRCATLVCTGCSTSALVRLPMKDRPRMPWIPQHDMLAIVVHAIARLPEKERTSNRNQEMCVHWDAEPNDKGIFAYAHQGACHAWTKAEHRP